jgi:hypothetical protein
MCDIGSDMKDSLYSIKGSILIKHTNESLRYPINITSDATAAGISNIPAYRILDAWYCKEMDKYYIHLVIFNTKTDCKKSKTDFKHYEIVI